MNIFCIQKEMKKEILKNWISVFTKMTTVWSFFLLSFGLSSQTLAFSTNPSLSLQNQTIEITKEGNTANITHTYTLTNPTEETQTFREILPLSQGANNPKLFIESDGTNLQVLSSQNRLESLWNIAAETQDPSFLRFGADRFPSLSQSQEIQIPPQTTQEIKYQYTQTIPNKQGWQWLNIFIPQNETSTQFRLEYDQNEYILSNIPELADTIPFLHENKTFLQQEIFSSNSPQWIAWSNGSQPLTTHYKGLNYNLFSTPYQNRNPENITLLIDQSGSITNAKWQKTIEATRYLLNEVLQNKNVQIGLFTDSIQWLTKEEEAPIFKANTFELRQEIFNALEINRPLGKTDLTKTLGEYNTLNLTVPNRVLTLITDEKAPESHLQTPTLILHTGSPEERQTWKTKTHNTPHWLLPLHTGNSTLVESNDLKNHWRQWKQNNQTFVSTLSDENQEYLPQVTFKSHTPFPLFSVGRQSERERTNEKIHWLPGTWGQYKIQELETKEEPTQIDQDAIASIKTVFGLRDNPQFVKGVPSYEDKGDWKTYDFHERNNPNTFIKIAPFSEAQKHLFLNHSSYVAEGFSINKNTSFCTDIRCIEVEEGHTEDDPTPYIKAYWNERDKNHWALPYVQKLVAEGEYPLKDSGDLELETPIMRGDFIQMMYNQIPTYRWRTGKPLSFTDLPEDNPYHEAITWFSQHKIITGYPDETVRPNQPLSRAEAVKILLATDGYKTINDEDPLFADSTTWERPWVNEASRRGYVNGFTPTQFKPHQPLTKGQAAKLIVKFFQE